MSGRGSGPHYPDWDDDPHSLDNMQRRIMEHTIKKIEREEKAEADQEGGENLPPPPVGMRMRMRKPTRVEVVYGYLRYWMPVFRDLAIVILITIIVWRGW